MGQICPAGQFDNPDVKITGGLYQALKLMNFIDCFIPLLKLAPAYSKTNSFTF